MYNMLKSTDVSQCGPSMVRCGLCGSSEKPFTILSRRLYSSDSDDDDRRGLAEDLREQVTCILLFEHLILDLSDNLLYDCSNMLSVKNKKDRASALCTSLLHQLVLGRTDVCSLLGCYEGAVSKGSNPVLTRDLAIESWHLIIASTMIIVIVKRGIFLG